MVHLTPLALWALLAVALCLRLWRLSTLGFDEDELATIHFAHQPLRQVLFGPGFDNHPPLYYGLMHVWLAVAGESEIALRLPSVLLSVLGVWLAFAVGRKLLNDMAGWSGAIGLALLPTYIYEAQDGRMYDLMIVIALLSTWTLADFVARPDRGRSLRYLLATVLLIYAQSAGVFIVMAQNAFWLVATVTGMLPRRRGPILWWIGVQALIVALYAPWLVVAAGRLSSMQDTFWVKHESVISYMGGLFFIYAGTDRYLPVYLIAPLMALLIVLACVWAARRITTPGGQGRLILPAAVTLAASFAALPGLAMAIISQLSQPIFIPRAILPSAVACFWLAGFALSLLPSRLRLAVAALLLMAMLATIAQFEATPPRGASSDMRQGFRDLIGHVRPGDVVYLDGWPEARDYMVQTWTAAGAASKIPPILTNRVGDADTALRRWCQSPRQNAVIVVHVFGTHPLGHQIPFYGLIKDTDYVAIFARERLAPDDANFSYGQYAMWHCRGQA